MSSARLSLLCFYLYFRHSREHTPVIMGQAAHGEATAVHSASALKPGPGLPSTHVTAHCGPNELPEAQAEYLMRLLSVNGYCDQGRVPVHLAEGLHNSGPTAGSFSPAGGLRLVPCHWDASTPASHTQPMHTAPLRRFPYSSHGTKSTCLPSCLCSSNQR